MTNKTHKSLKERFYSEAVPALIKEFSLSSDMAAPRLKKVVVNMGTGELLRNKESKEKLIKDVSLITGQKPKVQPARVSIAGFSVREGMPVGLTVTLRRDKMFSFVEKLITVVLPRLRDFRGVPKKSFDKAGNYTLGMAEHTSFPEIDLTTVDRPHGLEITMVFSNSNPEMSRRALEILGMPFEKEEENG